MSDGPIVNFEDFEEHVSPTISEASRMVMSLHDELHDQLRGWLLNAYSTGMRDGYQQALCDQRETTDA